MSPHDRKAHEQRIISIREARSAAAAAAAVAAAATAATNPNGTTMM